MHFQPTPVNVITLLLIGFALYVLYFLSTKRLDSNMPLLFYALVLVFARYSDRPVNPYLFSGGLLLALLLRFEFMNSSFAKFILLTEMLAITGIVMSFVTVVLD